MSLAFSFQLTPRQTQLLLTCVYGHYKEIGTCCIGEPPSYLPDFDHSGFVCVGKKLIDKGLLSHSNDQKPTWQPTDAGRAMAGIIVADARKIIAYQDNQKPIPMPVVESKKQPKGKQ